jgi:hypothetical protein
MARRHEQKLISMPRSDAIDRKRQEAVDTCKDGSIKDGSIAGL